MVSAEDQTNPMSFWALFFLTFFLGRLKQQKHPQFRKGLPMITLW